MLSNFVQPDKFLLNCIYCANVEVEEDSLDEEEVVIVMEIAEVIEKHRKDKLPALRNVPKKKLLGETAKVDKVLSKFRGDKIDGLEGKPASVAKQSYLTIPIKSLIIQIYLGSIRKKYCILRISFI